VSDYSPTAASVLASLNAQQSRGVAGVPITAGQALAINTDRTLHLAGAAAGAPLNVFAGFALDGAAAGQPINYSKLDPNFTPGFAVPAGMIVVLSATPGNVCPHTDLATGMVPTDVGHGIGGNQIALNPVSGGVPMP
jgi:hypothetical protein